MRTLLCILVLCVVGLGARPTTQPEAGDGVVATFERQFKGGLTSMKLTFGDDTAPEGTHFATLTPTTREAGKAYVRLALPPDVTPVGRASLSAQLRAPGAGAPIEMRWLALDAGRRVLFLRRFDLPPGDAWVRIEEPLHGWRWDNRRVGDWDEVKEIALVVGSPDVRWIDVDDVRLTGSETEADRAKWLLRVAFGDRPVEQGQADGFLVATDAVEGFADDDLKHQLDDMRRARKFVRRAFGDVVRPTDQHDQPISLLIFEDAADYPAFVETLGREFRVTITPPRAGGYTIQDISSSTYKPDLGPRRPVYLHEAVHGIVARDLRLLSGNALHNPLQEGIANFVQICVFPTSLDPATFRANFDKPIDPSGKGFFKPLETLFSKPVTTREYAQLAGVVAYLLERDPELLRSLARGLADGTTATDVLAMHGTTWKEFEAKWFAWGRERYQGNARADAPLFDVPVELRSSQ